MQKKLIALAVAGIASSSAFAQMNVTVYGNIDLSLVQASGTSSGTQGGSTITTGNGIRTSGLAAGAATDPLGSVTTMNTGNRSSSRIGFKGTEDLGGGLKASFVVESGLTADGATGQAAPSASTSSGSGLVGSRDTSIALAGGFGNVKFGRFKFKTLDKYGDFDATTDSGIGSIGYLSYSPLNSTYNNSILYETPNYGGLVVSYQIAMSENQDKVAVSNGGSITGLMFKYSAGPIAAQFAQTIARDAFAGPTWVAGASTTVTNRGKTVTVNTLGASYDFGVAKLMSNYLTVRNNTVGAETARTIDANTWNLGVTVPMGAGLVRVNYVNTNDKRENNADANSWYLGYDYSLSKRTTAYFGAAAVKNSNGAAFSANADTTAAMTGVTKGNTTTAATLATAASGGRTNAFIAGMNHTF